MKLRSGLLTFSILLGMGIFSPTASLAQTPPADDAAMAATITSSVQTILTALNDPFGKGMGAFTSLGWNCSPQILDFKDGPRIEIGAGLGAQIVDLPDLSTLTSGVTYIDPGATVDIPTFLPLPFPVATARVGLFNGLDVGGKLIYIPSFDLSSIGIGVSAEMTGYGFDVRFKVVDDPLLPTIAVGMSYDHMTGNVTVSTDLNQSVSITTGPNDLIINGTAAYSLDWDLTSVGARVIAGKDLVGFYVYGVVGFQRNSGSVTSTFSGLHFTYNSGGSGGDQTLSDVVVTQAPPLFEPKFLVGLDVGEGFKWGLFGESNGVDLAFGTNFKAQL